jgi:hypothetical protein
MVSTVLHALFCYASALCTRTNPSPSATFYFASGRLGGSWVGIHHRLEVCFLRGKAVVLFVVIRVLSVSLFSCILSCVGPGPIGPFMPSVQITGTPRVGRGVRCIHRRVCGVLICISLFFIVTGVLFCLLYVK